MITDPALEQQLVADRRATGADRYDEVWEGIYMMAPMPNTEHQQIVSRFVSILEELVGWPGLGTVAPGVNVSDRKENWIQNYRVPDAAVAIKGGVVEDCGTHWYGGPEFLIEVVSEGDQTQEKIAFYTKLGVGELLIINRKPWSLELHRVEDDGQVTVATSDFQTATLLTSAKLPLTFRLATGDARPNIEVAHSDTGKTWLV